MRRTPEQMMAYALEIDPTLLPFVGELLADFDELGSDAERIVEVLESQQLSNATRVLDLGCGKGAVALEIAEDLGWRVRGIDLCEPLISAARASAQRLGLADKCRFEMGDAIEVSHRCVDSPDQRYDVVVMAALGDVLGSWRETVSILRRCVVPGGLILISDCFLREDGSNRFPGFENYLGREETIAQLTGLGDRLVASVVDPDEEPRAQTQQGDRGLVSKAAEPVETQAENTEPDSELDLIRRRAKVLAERHPEHADALRGFVEGQKAEGEFLEQNMTDVIWLLERGAD